MELDSFKEGSRDNTGQALEILAIARLHRCTGSPVPVKVEIRIDFPHGLMGLSLREAENHVKVRFSRTPPRLSQWSNFSRSAIELPLSLDLGQLNGYQDPDPLNQTQSSR